MLPKVAWCKDSQGITDRLVNSANVEYLYIAQHSNLAVHRLEPLSFWVGHTIYKHRCIAMELSCLRWDQI